MSEVNSKIVVNLDNNTGNQIKQGSKRIIENTNSINTMSNNVEEVEIEPTSNFLDDFYEALGSDRLSKETGIDCFEAQGYDFVEKSDIKTVERRGAYNENILVTLDNDDSYLFVNENGQMILGSITDKRGSTICFPDGFNAFIKMVRPSKKSGDPIDIDRVMVADGTLSVEILGVIYEFDMASGQLKTIFNRNTNDVISRNDIDNTMKEFSERLASYLNNGTTATDIMNKYNLTADNLSYINMDYDGQLSLNFNGVSIKVNNSDYGTTYMISQYSEIEEIAVPDGEMIII